MKGIDKDRGEQMKTPEQQIEEIVGQSIYMFDTSTIPRAAWWQRILNHVLPKNARLKGTVITSAKLSLYEEDE